MILWIMTSSGWQGNQVDFLKKRARLPEIAGVTFHKLRLENWGWNFGYILMSYGRVMMKPIFWFLKHHKPLTEMLSDLRTTGQISYAGLMLVHGCLSRSYEKAIRYVDRWNTEHFWVCLKWQQLQEKRYFGFAQWSQTCSCNSHEQQKGAFSMIIIHSNDSDNVRRQS